MVKYKKYITYEMEEYPLRCNECPAFKQNPYMCHNERGMEGSCELGYMAGKDMRDFTGNTKFLGCRMGADKRVKICK